MMTMGRWRCELPSKAWKPSVSRMRQPPTSRSPTMLMVCARASSNVIWQNSDLQRAGIIVVAELLSWLCLQTRFRQILEGARIVDRRQHTGERRASSLSCSSSRAIWPSIAANASSSAVTLAWSICYRATPPDAPPRRTSWSPAATAVECQTAAVVRAPDCRAHVWLAPTDRAPPA